MCCVLAKPSCAAGRSAFFGGSWTEPCDRTSIHSIGSPKAEPIWLCDEHFQEVKAAGLVKEAFIDETEFQRRERERLAVTAAQPTPRRWFRRK
jgi:hypothetical protein